MVDYGRIPISPVGNVGGVTPDISAPYTVAASGSAFAAGDLMGNSNTAGSVVPIEFDLVHRSGDITGARCAVSAASGSPVLTNLAFDLLIFRPVADIPFAGGGYPANNGLITFADADTARAALAQLIAQISFFADAATQGLPGWTEYGTSVQAAYQRGTLVTGIARAPVNVNALQVTTVLGLMCAREAWDNGNVAHTFDFALDGAIDAG